MLRNVYGNERLSVLKWENNSLKTSNLSIGVDS